MRLTLCGDFPNEVGAGFIEGVKKKEEEEGVYSAKNYP